MTDRPVKKENINTSVHQNHYDIQDACRDLGFNQCKEEYDAMLPKSVGEVAEIISQYIIITDNEMRLAKEIFNRYGGKDE